MATDAAAPAPKRLKADTQVCGRSTCAAIAQRARHSGACALMVAAAAAAARTRIAASQAKPKPAAAARKPASARGGRADSTSGASGRSVKAKGGARKPALSSLAPKASQQPVSAAAATADPADPFAFFE